MAGHKKTSPCETRLREQNFLCSTVALGVRDNRLMYYDQQAKLPYPTANTLGIWDVAMELLRRRHMDGEPVRSLSVKASGLTPADGKADIFEDFITPLGGLNRHNTPLMINSFYIIDDEKQRGKMTEEFYAEGK